MNKKLLFHLLQIFDVEENYNWGEYSIRYGKHHFKSLEDIPESFIKTHSELDKYTVVPTMSDKQYASFIIYRLVEKLEYPKQRQQLHLSQQKLTEFLFNEAFMTTFIEFLKAQTIASVYIQLENNILLVYKNAKQIQSHYSRQSAIRKSNNAFLKHISNKPDEIWSELVRISKHI